VYVTLSSVRNKGHFTLVAETVFRLHLPSHCSGVNEICHVTHSAHVLRAVKDGSKSVSDEWHFTIDAETVFHPHIPSHYSGVPEICHIKLPAHALREVQVRLESVSNKGTLLLRPKEFFVLNSPGIVVG
jgi:hypothetical protein